MNVKSIDMLNLSPTDVQTSPRENRMTKTPTQVKGMQPYQIQKFKKAKLANSSLKEMVVLYADMGGKHLRQ